MSEQAVVDHCASIVSAEFQTVSLIGMNSYRTIEIVHRDTGYMHEVLDFYTIVAVVAMD